MINRRRHSEAEARCRSEPGGVRGEGELATLLPSAGGSAAARRG